MARAALRLALARLTEVGQAKRSVPGLRCYRFMSHARCAWRYPPHALPRAGHEYGYGVNEQRRFARAFGLHALGPQRLPRLLSERARR